ncbi:catalase [Russula earlei]|uniref:Catalase n=1 Tax=Russula earlei TaxID=71964 RepID=A0ACC0TT58_9AGAM|nr:catalase [Russula earlei]
MASKQITNNENAVYTTSNGAPVARPYAAEKIGLHGPLLLQAADSLPFCHPQIFITIDLLAHFDRERIPERVVHAKGAGAHGYFEVTHDITDLTSAALFKKVGNRARSNRSISTVGGESDPRGFAIKIRTEEGNLDWVFNNTPVFFIRDPAKFPHFIHTQKRNPQSHLKDPDMFWDYLSQNPESIHQTVILFTDRGTPDGYHNMHGYSGHPFKFVRDDGEWVYIQVHIRADGGFKTLDNEIAGRLSGENPDYGIQALFKAIEKKQYPSWTVYVQTMTPQQAENFRYNILDLTKVWPHKEYPLRPIGKLVLDENPQNYFAEIEQSAFSPSHTVPGIEPSADPVLQSRLFSSRLTLLLWPVANFQRDGFATFVNQGARPNYQSTISPLTYREKPYANTEHKHEVWAGYARAHLYEVTELDFEQPRNLYRKVLSDLDRKHLVDNIAGHLGLVKSAEIKARQLSVFAAVDQGLSDAIAKAIGVPTVHPLKVTSAASVVPLKTNIGQTTVTLA